MKGIKEMDWQRFIDMAVVDLRAIEANDRRASLGHLRDAIGNLTKAVETLEDEADFQERSKR